MVRPGGEPVLRKRGHAMDGNGSILTKAGISATRGGEETARFKESLPAWSMIEASGLATPGRLIEVRSTAAYRV
ncbi:hypothetical protein Shyhy02_36000 [Streptomyces hygroscopicus subsp. hygroscopicus]|nr:hypothetical protein Shyhy02_36000 [Streptomyces hygroscopicus subsp. hygroscopicus]